MCEECRNRIIAKDNRLKASCCSDLFARVTEICKNDIYLIHTIVQEKSTQSRAIHNLMLAPQETYCRFYFVLEGLKHNG